MKKTDFFTPCIFETFLSFLELSKISAMFWQDSGGLCVYK